MKYVMLGISSNFGNMFSVAGASVFLPFLPMLPVQILLNNLLYDVSQSTITTDNVDREYVEKPKRWDIAFIRRFMVSLGPVSSLFDFLTFFTMLLVFNATASLFQTAWFIESLCSQTLVVFVIRSRKTPFYKSKPSKYLLASSLGIIGFALVVPFTPLGSLFGFVPPPPAFFVALALILSAYLLLAEVVKSWFYKHNAYRLEQVLIPKRKPFYLNRTAKFMQDMVAVISLRFEDEISIDSLTEDLNSVIIYPINPNQVVRNFQYLRRSGLISVDWHTRMIKREKPLKEYVTKTVTASEMWPTIAEDWRRINTIVQNKRNRANAEYQELLSPKQ
jgi:hypothetical protein